jgi:hypothetical protein
MSLLYQPDLAQAILELAPESKVSIPEENINKIAWHCDNPNEITVEQIQTKYDELIAAYDAQEYARNRKEEYDALNQFELISDDDANGTTTHKDAIAAVKTKWPKDNSGPK